MALNELQDCIKKGLILRIAPSREAAEKSIARSETWLIEAKGVLDAGRYDSCILAAYAAMFHAIRALLIRDGYRERSHYCTARYVEEKYVRKGLLPKEVVALIDDYRELRHDAAYSLEFEAGEKDARDAVRDAKRIIDSIKKVFDK
jgi:uncharacterized protein (UPF0332 family)